MAYLEHVKRVLVPEQKLLPPLELALALALFRRMAPLALAQLFPLDRPPDVHALHVPLEGPIPNRIEQAMLPVSAKLLSNAIAIAWAVILQAPDVILVLIPDSLSAIIAMLDATLLDRPLHLNNGLVQLDRALMTSIPLHDPAAAAATTRLRLPNIRVNLSEAAPGQVPTSRLPIAADPPLPLCVASVLKGEI